MSVGNYLLSQPTILGSVKTNSSFDGTTTKCAIIVRKTTIIKDGGTKMITCPKCGAKVIISQKCENPACDYMVTSIKTETQNNPIDEIVSQKYVYIIAHEYKRLLTMMNRGEIFGSILQLKDVWEILLKFPILISIISLYNNKSEKKNEILNLLYEKKLNLGDWKKIGDKIKKLKLYPTKDVGKILDNILDLYNGQREDDIIKWRNDNIGHGALSLNENDEIRTALNYQISRIRNHLSKCEKNYLALTMGKNELIVSGIHQSISPFIKDENGTYWFFDTFISGEGKTCYLDYINGRKIRENDPTHIKIYNELTKDFENEKLTRQEESYIDDNVYLSESYAFVTKKLYDESNRITPDFLLDWLKNNILKNQKSVSILEMEQGMGKTTFCSLVGKRKDITKDTTVKIVYITSTMITNRQQFLMAVYDILCDIGNGETIKGYIKELGSLLNNHSSQQENFAKLINRFQEIYYKNVGKKNLLLFLDGMDEYDSKRLNDSLFDIIPDSPQLNDNVYLVLTIRTQPEIAPELNAAKENKHFDEIKIVNRYDEDYINTLKEYTKKHILIIDAKNTSAYSEEEVNKILSLCDRKFLYVALIEKIARYTNIIDFHDSKQIIDSFLSILRETYSEKFYYNIECILAVLASAKEPLSLEEIAILIGEERLNFKILGMFADIKDLLFADHTNGDNRLRFSHETTRSYLCEKFHNTLLSFIPKWKDYILKININNPLKLYLIAYIKNYCTEYGVEFTVQDEQSILTIANQLLLELLIDFDERNDYSSYSRILAFRDGYLTTSNCCNHVSTLTNILLTMYTHGTKEQLDIIESVDIDNFPSDFSKSVIYFLKGRIYHSNDQYAQSLRYSLLAEKHQKSLVDNSLHSLSKKIALLKARNYLKLGQKEKAEEIYKGLVDFSLISFDTNDCFLSLEALANFDKIKFSFESINCLINRLKNDSNSIQKELQSYIFLSDYFFKKHEYYSANQMLNRGVDLVKHIYRLPMYFHLFVEISLKKSEIFLKCEEFQLARDLLERLLKETDKNNAGLSPLEKFSTFSCLARALLAFHETETALESLENSRTLLNEIGFNDTERCANLYLLFMEGYLQKKDWSTVKLYQNKIRDMVDENNQSRNLYKLLAKASLLYAKALKDFGADKSIEEELYSTIKVCDSFLDYDDLEVQKISSQAKKILSTTDFYKEMRF